MAVKLEDFPQNFVPTDCVGEENYRKGDIVIFEEDHALARAEVLENCSRDGDIAYKLRVLGAIQPASHGGIILKGQEFDYSWSEGFCVGSRPRIIGHVSLVLREKPTE